MSKKSVLLDLDGVLAEYRGWQGIENIGEPKPGAVAFTHELCKLARVVIYTTRCKSFLKEGHASTGGSDPDRRPVAELVAIVKSWLDRHGFAYDEIYSGQGKPFAAAIIDDRAVPCRPQIDDFAFSGALLRVEQLCEDCPPVSAALAEDEGLQP